ncbi:uncharacterized protein DEA37_0009903 [Paragonimus westermani]|uniref:Integrase catalytic domain-containing protein n=1 Tax=Paragonimus westermani TaxID=34504 RepID=A0A5J4P0N9_9TREM|nr:uncharacterized protein DEA37_0009903 [Paragonimus westermani]
MLKAVAQTSRNLISQPLWIIDPKYHDIHSMTRSDYTGHYHPAQDKHTQCLRARSFKPKSTNTLLIILRQVSAYRTTLSLTMPVSPRGLQDALEGTSITSHPNAYVLRSPGDYCVDDKLASRCHWRRTGQIIEHPEPFIGSSVYRHDFSYRNAVSTQTFVTGWGHAPTIITTDRGEQFESQLFDVLTNLVGTKHSFGLDQRFRRQLKAFLKAHEDLTHWTERLPIVLLGVNSPIKQDIGHSSVELVLGTTSRLSRQFLSPSKTNEYTDPSS